MIELSFSATQPRVFVGASEDFELLKKKSYMEAIT